MRDFEARLIAAGVFSLVLGACQPEPPSALVFTKVEESQPEEAPGTIARTSTTPSLGILVPRGFDALIPFPETDLLYDFLFRKTVIEGQRVTLLNYQNNEVVSKVDDPRGIDPRSIPDFGIYGITVPVKKHPGENISYSRKMLIWQNGKLEEEWGVIQNLPRTSNQAEKPRSERSFVSLVKGSHRFVQDIHVPRQQPSRYDLVVL